MQKTKLQVLANRLSEKYEQQPYLAKFWINAVFETILELIRKGETFTLAGFGTFELRKRKERKKYVFKSKECIIDKEHLSPVLRFSKKLKTEIKKKNI